MNTPAPSRITRRSAALLVLLVLTTALLGYRGVYRGLNNSMDFGLYYCSTIALVEGTDPYTPEVLRAIAQPRGVPEGVIENAIAPPICYVPLTPFVGMSWTAARDVWLGVNLLSIGLMFVWLRSIVGLKRDWLSPSNIALAIVVTGLAPLQTSLAFGQLAVTATTCVIGAVYYEMRGKTLLAAALFILAGLLKPQLAIGLVLYWAYRKQWRLIAYTAVGGFLITACTLAWLQWNNPDWFAAWQSNVHRLTHAGGASDFAQLNNYIFANLQVPLFALTRSATAASLGAWGVALCLTGVAFARLRRSINTTDAPPNHTHLLAVASIALCIAVIPIYHVYYDTAILALPATWAIASLCQGRHRRLAIATLLLLVPTLIPGQSFINYLAIHDHLPESFVQSLAYRAFILPHLPWLILGVIVCLLLSFKTHEKQLKSPQNNTFTTASNEV